MVITPAYEGGGQGLKGSAGVRESARGQVRAALAVRFVSVDTALLHDAGPSAAGMQNRRVDLCRDSDLPSLRSGRILVTGWPGCPTG